MRTLLRLLFTIAGATVATPVYAQPFLYSVKPTHPCTQIGCAATSIVITNAATGEVVNADDPPLLGPTDGLVYSMTMSVDGKRLYVSVGYPALDPGRVGRLYVINVVTNRIDATVPMGDRTPWILLADPNGRVLYGSHPLQGRIAIIDAITGQETGEIPLQYPFAMAVSPDGSLLAVTEPQPNTVTLLDPRTRTTRFRVDVGNAPQRVAMSPDGKRVYVSCHLGSGGAIVTIDTDTGVILNSVPLASHQPDRVLANPATGKIYVTFFTAGAWGVIDVAGTLTVHPADVPRSATMVASADWRRLYIAGTAGIIVIDTATDAPAGNLPGGSDLYLAASTPCDFVLPAEPSVFNGAGGTGIVNVPAPPGCEWAVQNVSLPPGLHITSASSGTGPGAVTYSIDPTPAPFTARIRIASQSAPVSVEIPRLWVDTPRDGAIVTSPFAIAGWALAESIGATASGIDVVHAWAFPSDGGPPRFLGSAAMDGARPDVASVFGSGYGRSGFSLTTPWLRPGRYQISVYGRSRTGQFDAFAAIHVTAVGESGAMALDFPSTDFVVQPGTPSIFVAGWAFDRAALSGNGADIVHAWAFPVGPGDPVFLGETTIGHARPDVGALFGSRFTASGFSVLLPAPRPGVYDVAVYARSMATGFFDQWRVVRITVLPPP